MATPTTPLRVAFCVLGLLAVLGDCSFKIIVSQNDSSLKPTDFVLYFNQTVLGAYRHEPVIWAVGSLSQPPTAVELVLHDQYTGLSAALQIGDEVYREGPFLARNDTYWLVSIAGDKTITLLEDGSPHKEPANGLRVTNQNPEYSGLSLWRHEAVVDGSGRVRYGPALAYANLDGTPWVDFPPVLSLTLTETYFQGNSLDYIGRPVSSLFARGQSTTFRVIPATREVTWQVALERRPDPATKGVFYVPTYKYSFLP